jgi:two-component sensor histidine kinase
MEAHFAAFIGRLEALLSTGELVLNSRSRQADLRTIAETSLRPFLDSNSASRVSVNGPTLSLSEKTAGGLALAIHELATNALKYGALKSPKGRVTLEWSLTPITDGERVAIEWKEYAEHPVAAPASRGFGSRVIAAAVSGEADPHSDLLFEPDGLRCRFEFLKSPNRSGIMAQTPQEMNPACA